MARAPRHQRKGAELPSSGRHARSAIDVIGAEHLAGDPLAMLGAASVRPIHLMTSAVAAASAWPSCPFTIRSASYSVITGGTSTSGGGVAVGPGAMRESASRKFVAIVGEIESDAAGGGKDRRAGWWAQAWRSAVPRPRHRHEILEIQMNVVENVSDIGSGRLFRGWPEAPMRPGRQARISSRRSHFRRTVRLHGKAGDDCGLPLSKSRKSSGADWPMARPLLSRTTTGTETRFTLLLKVAGDSRDAISGCSGGRSAGPAPDTGARCNYAATRASA